MFIVFSAVRRTNVIVSNIIISGTRNSSPVAIECMSYRSAVVVIVMMEGGLVAWRAGVQLNTSMISLEKLFLLVQ